MQLDKAQNNWHLLQVFQKHLHKVFNLQLADNKVILVAISGGVDSMVLAYLMHILHYKVQLAHVNYSLRNEESDRDEAAVIAFANKYQMPLYIKKVATKKLAEEQKKSIQVTARNIRYWWFQELLNGNIEADVVGYNQANEKAKINLIATAHHSDDAVETMLMHFFRGTGLQGLASIPEQQKEQKIIRPLLAFSKQEILAFAKEHTIDFVEDSSNASEKYTRNFFRNSLLPLVKNSYPQVEENLYHNVQRFKETNEIFQLAVQKIIKQVVVQKGQDAHINIGRLAKHPQMQTILWEIIKVYHFTASQLTEIVKLFTAENGSHIASGTHQIIVNRGWLIITKQQSDAADIVLITAGEKRIHFKEGILEISTLNAPIENIITERFVASIDADKISFPLILRRWKEGDYFYPLGMEKKKKLSRFFIDQKLSMVEKNRAWVLVSNNTIIWCVGYRIDNRVKLTSNTKQLLQIHFKPNV